MYHELTLSANGVSFRLGGVEMMSGPPELEFESPRTFFEGALSVRTFIIKENYIGTNLSLPLSQSARLQIEYTKGPHVPPPSLAIVICAVVKSDKWVMWR